MLLQASLVLVHVINITLHQLIYNLGQFYSFYKSDQSIDHTDCAICGQIYCKGDCMAAWVMIK